MSSKDWIEKDFYAVLGVDKAASADDIKKAYRKVARESHPDHNPGDPKAEERFKAASEAYNVLSDTGRRREYDEMRSLFGSGAFRRSARGGGQPGGMPFDVSDMLRRRWRRRPSLRRSRLPGPVQFDLHRWPGRWAGRAARSGPWSGRRDRGGTGLR